MPTLHNGGADSAVLVLHRAISENAAGERGGAVLDGREGREVYDWGGLAAGRRKLQKSKRKLGENR